MRVYNFSAGPSMLPEAVLKKAQAEFLNYEGSGMSVVEMSHRGKVFDGIAKKCQALLREIMGISDDYHVLFLQGGASQQFDAVPLNLMKTGKADYVVTGNFSGKAAKEGARYGDATTPMLKRQLPRLKRLLAMRAEFCSAKAAPSLLSA